jgi:hypothetical protein
MAQQRAKTSTASKKSTGAAAAPLVRRDATDPAPFFSLGAAHFSDAIAVTKVISVVLPLRHLRDKTILHEMVLKKLLHRSFEPSAEDLAQQAQHDGHGRKEEEADASGLSLSAADMYVIVHVKSVEVHADTARQVNPQGDVQVNVMTTLVAARVQHGLISGVAEPSPFASCMQVRLPSVPVSADVAAVESKAATDTMNLDAVRLDGGSPEAEADSAALSAGPSEAASSLTERQLRVTARCLEDEPVVPGQAVLLVSEPAAMRCLAVRPPRDAPGTFFFAEDTTVGPTGVAATATTTRRKRASPKNTEAAEGDEGTGEKVSARAEGRRVVVIDCDVAETHEKGGCDRKRPRP